MKPIRIAPAFLTALLALRCDSDDDNEAETIDSCHEPANFTCTETPWAPNGPEEYDAVCEEDGDAEAGRGCPSDNLIGRCVYNEGHPMQYDILYYEGYTDGTGDTPEQNCMDIGANWYES